MNHLFIIWGKYYVCVCIKHAKLWLCVSWLIFFRPIWMNGWTAAGVSFILTTVMRISIGILASMPASVWIIFFDNWWFFLDYLWRKFNSFKKQGILKNKNLTSVLAQLQLIAVHRNIFIRSIIKNRTPKAIVNQSNHDGRTPVSSQTGEITVTNLISIIFDQESQLSRLTRSFCWI